MKKENIIKRLKNYLTEIRGELKKVTWPSKPDLYKTTIAVLVSSVVFGVYLFIVDFTFSKIINHVIGIFK